MKRVDKKEEAKEFSRLIEIFASNNNVSLVDAIVEHCAKTGIEIDVAAKLISSSLKKKIREEAIARNQLKIKKVSLPI